MTNPKRASQSKKFKSPTDLATHRFKSLESPWTLQPKQTSKSLTNLSTNLFWSRIKNRLTLSSRRTPKKRIVKRCKVTRISQIPTVTES